MIWSMDKAVYYHHSGVLKLFYKHPLAANSTWPFCEIKFIDTIKSTKSPILVGLNSFPNFMLILLQTSFTFFSLNANLQFVLSCNRKCLQRIYSKLLLTFAATSSCEKQWQMLLPNSFSFFVWKSFEYQSIHRSSISF